MAAHKHEYFLFANCHRKFLHSACITQYIENSFIQSLSPQDMGVILLLLELCSYTVYRLKYKYSWFVSK